MRTTSRIAKTGLAAIMALIAALTVGDGASAQERAARDLFGAQSTPAPMRPAALGFYSKGCLAGAAALPADGANWQAVRLSRNRNWGHPDMIALLERLAGEAAGRDGWPGLLVGDISQPRGGPMPFGHASHQIGLDADIWLTPMPRSRLSGRQRERMEFRSLLKPGTRLVDPARWTDAHARLIMRAASYPRVERIFVHPGIKKQLCDTWRGSRANLGKVRPNWGHDSHFHIRMKCPAGAPGCTSQRPVGRGTDCDESLAWWFTDEPWKPADPDTPQARPDRLSDLPNACAAVLAAPASGGAPAAAAQGAAIADVPIPSRSPRAR